jgi:hypothetical protein
MAPMGLNGVAAPQLFGYDFGVDATPYYTDLLKFLDASVSFIWSRGSLAGTS